MPKLKNCTNEKLQDIVDSLDSEGSYLCESIKITLIRDILTTWGSEYRVPLSFGLHKHHSTNITPQTLVEVGGTFLPSRNIPLCKLTREWVVDSKVELILQDRIRREHIAERIALKEPRKLFVNKLRSELGGNNKETQLIIDSINFTSELDQDYAFEMAKVQYKWLLKITRVLEEL
jgi:hypothetical protein